MLLLYIIGVLFSMWFIAKCCDYFEEGADFIGRNLSDGVKGATVNAIGSSLPELLATTIALLIYLNTDGFTFGIGTTAGSAIFNAAIIPAAVLLMVTMTGVAKRVDVSRKVILRDGLFLLGAEFLLIMVLSDGTLTWTHGAVMIGFYLIYITYMLKSMGDSESDDEDEFDDDMNSGKAWKYLLLSTAGISFACWILVEACYGIGNSMGIDIYFVSVILAAAATSVPDTIISLKDAKKGNYDDAVANALGSNIFDICVCLGLPLMMFTLFTGTPIVIDVASAGNVAELRVLLLVMTFLIFMIALIGKGGNKLTGWLYLAIYGAFVTYIVARVLENETALQISIYLKQTMELL